MDFPVKHLRKFPSRQDGMRAVAERVPQAEAMATLWIGRSRPMWATIYGLRRRIATITVTILACLLFVHVMLGANGMVVYKQKRAEYDSLRKQIVKVQDENDRYTQQVQALESDRKAIEKEAREQLGYAKPGEYVYVQPAPAKAAVPANHSAKN
jgi:cell division protein FtsB